MYGDLQILFSPAGGANLVGIEGVTSRRGKERNGMEGERKGRGETPPECLYGFECECVR